MVARIAYGPGYFRPPWAVTSAGRLYTRPAVARLRDFSHRWGIGIREQVFIRAESDEFNERDGETGRFESAAAALLDPVPLYPAHSDIPGHTTGVQENGFIAYIP